MQDEAAEQGDEDREDQRADGRGIGDAHASAAACSLRAVSSRAGILLPASAFSST